MMMTVSTCVIIPWGVITAHVGLDTVSHQLTPVHVKVGSLNYGNLFETISILNTKLYLA